MTPDPTGRYESGPGGGDPPGPDSVPGLEPGRPGAPPDAAVTVFGDRLPLAVAYAELLATEGVLRGLIGPREAPRIWDRHLLNCAVVAELVPPGQVVLDVGSGAGLPGLVLAIVRPDLVVGLIEPLARRAEFLREAVTVLGLADSVTVCRARAEDLVAEDPVAGGRPADVVTARAVAPLDRLAGWCLPLAAVGGRLLALKGSSAVDEVAEYRQQIDRLGGATPVVRRCGTGVVEPPATVVEIVRERVVKGRPARPARTARAGRAVGGGRRRQGRG